MGAWEWILVSLLVGSVAIMFWYEATTDPALRRILAYVDLALVVFFVLEWGWRVVRADHSGRYAAGHAWELVGMVPLLAPVPSFLRFLRLFRLVRILRVFGRIGQAMGTWERIAKESAILKIGAVAGSITFLGAMLVWALERNAPDAHITSFRIAVWWAIVTVTTVGYGDVTPVTPTGQFVAALLMITGIGTIGALASSVASVLVVRKEAEVAAEGIVAPPVMAGGLPQHLETLSALHERGRLTDDEYAKAKAKVLAP
ncbi:MAG: voltage-gated potassium channel [Thermoplasmata archaeon]|nr:voltage-gated potassium channel [Thermoplasmata archaeon]MEA3165971.1 voltage-gated potassium channel [Thermoplasmata archaeon]